MCFSAASWILISCDRLLSGRTTSETTGDGRPISDQVAGGGGTLSTGDLGAAVSAGAGDSGPKISVVAVAPETGLSTAVSANTMVTLRSCDDTQR